MAKNNRVIAQCKAMHRQILNITPQIYASLAVALHRSGVDDDGIEYIFALSQEVWSECVNSGVNMVQMCIDETGIDVQRTVESNDQ